MQTKQKKIQALQFSVFKEFDTLCKKNNISYIVAYGSMLGAVRHSGFIPWDDDFDVAMLRSEYNRFIKAAEKEWGLESKVFLQNYNTDAYFPHTFTRIGLKNTLAVQKSWQFAKFDMPLFIDVFVYDKLPEKKYIRFFQRKLISFFMNLKRWKSGVHQTFKLNNNSVPKKNILKLIKSLPYDIGFLSIKTINKCQDQIQQWGFSSNKRSSYPYVANFYTGEKHNIENSICRFEDFKEVEYREFEGLKVPVPKTYDKILTNLYGDYMKYPPR